MSITQWRRHIDQVVNDEGQWIGLADENGYPFMDLPMPVSISAAELKLSSATAELVAPVTPGDALMTELADGELGTQDSEGRLKANPGPARFLVVCRPNARLYYKITHVVLEGTSAPSTMTIHGEDLLSDLAFWPAPSIPVAWTESSFQTWLSDASGIDYTTPRDLALIEMATAADGYTLRGPARDIIRTIIQDSFDAANTLMGWEPHAVVDHSDDPIPSPERLIRVTDDYILDTVSDPAVDSGVSIQVDMWWPGDPPITRRAGKPQEYTAGTDNVPVEYPAEPIEFDYPVQVVRVTQIKEV